MFFSGIYKIYECFKSIEEDDEFEEKSIFMNEEHELEILINENGWFETAKLKKGQILDILKSHDHCWTHAKGYINKETGKCELESGLIEVDLDKGMEEQIPKNQKELYPWKTLLLHFPETIPSFKSNGEILIVFGDKGIKRKDSSNESIHLNFFNGIAQESFHEYNFENEMIIKANEINIYELSNWINHLKPHYSNSFILVYQEKTQTKWIRINCDSRNIAFIWVDSGSSFNEEDIEINKKRLKNDQFPINSKPFYISDCFIIFSLFDSNSLTENKQVDLIIINESCEWIQQKHLILHKLIKKI